MHGFSCQPVSLDLFVTENEFGDEIAWRGWHERLGGALRTTQGGKNSTFGLRGGGYLLHDSSRLELSLIALVWLLDKDMTL